MNRIGFLSQNQAPQQPSHYSNALDSLKVPTTDSAGFDHKIERPQTGDVFQIDRYNCQVLAKLILDLQEKVEATLVKSLPETEKILTYKRDTPAHDVSQVTTNLLASAKELSSYGDFATELLKKIDTLFIEPPLINSQNKPHENTRMGMIVFSARNILRDYGRETDSVAGQMRSLTLNLAADTDSRDSVSFGSLISAQSTALSLINAQRNLQRFVIALDGPVGFRAIAAESDKSAAA